MKPSLYFGHPVNTYDTDLEHALIGVIGARFPEYLVENPNRPEHQRAYREWKARTGNGMDYYYRKVLPNMDAGIFLPFEDGMWGAGVYHEAAFLHSAGKPVWGITWNGMPIFIPSLNPEFALSIEETKKRVYGPQRI